MLALVSVRKGSLGSSSFTCFPSSLISRESLLYLNSEKEKINNLYCKYKSDWNTWCNLLVFECNIASWFLLRGDYCQLPKTGSQLFSKVSVHGTLVFEPFSITGRSRTQALSLSCNLKTKRRQNFFRWFVTFSIKACSHVIHSYTLEQTTQRSCRDPADGAYHPQAHPYESYVIVSKSICSI